MRPVIAELPANLTRGEPVGVHVPVDGIALERFEKRVEAVLTRGEPLAGQRQDLRGENGPRHRPGGTGARRRA